MRKFICAFNCEIYLAAKSDSVGCYEKFQKGPKVKESEIVGTKKWSCVWKTAIISASIVIVILAFFTHNSSLAKKTRFYAAYASKKVLNKNDLHAKWVKVGKCSDCHAKI